MREVDERKVYSLMRTAQMMAGQTDLVNEMRIQLDDAFRAREIADRVAGQIGYRAIPWQEANADLLSSLKVQEKIMNVIMAAMMLASTFAIYSIISTITNEKRNDIAIMKSLGMKEYFVQAIFITEAVMIAIVGIPVGWLLGYLLCFATTYIKYSNPITEGVMAIAPYYSVTHYIVVGMITSGVLPVVGLPAVKEGQSRSSGRHHTRRVMTETVVQTVGLMRRVESGTAMATIVNGIDLTVNKGEFLAITGPSGSGKSSLLYLIGLLDAPTEGEIFICGQPTSAMSDSERSDMRLSKLGFVFQFHFLLPEFSALENVLLPMRTLGELSETEMREKGTKLLTSLGLGDQVSRKPSQLSGGQRQRVAIARALANDPAIIVADEPTGNLDTVSTNQVFEIMREVANSGRTVIVVTHDVGLAARADRRVNVVDGKIAGIFVNEAAQKVPVKEPQ